MFFKSCYKILVLFIAFYNFGFPAGISAQELKINPHIYKIWRSRYPQYFDPSYDMTKRYNTFEFGLGKRTNPYEFGIGKRIPQSGFSLERNYIPFPSDISLADDAEKPSLPNHLSKRDVTTKSPGNSDLLFEKSGIVQNDDDYLPIINGDTLDFIGPEFTAKYPTYQDKYDRKEQLEFEEEKNENKRRGLKEAKNFYSFSLEKRDPAMYEFGIGKRLPTVYEFGLGKRRPSMYELGLGRGDSSAYEFDLGKRVPGVYEFGLGKRRPALYEFGLGKRSPSVYEFGLGKRSPSVYEFGLGKRSPSVYEFGLGKRAPSVYEFGLGKKRQAVYEFGPGKRRPPIYEFGLGKRSAGYNFGLGKRGSEVYEFGLGKRYSWAYKNDLEKHEPKVYEFGLGKRVFGDYEFGLGKRTSKLNEPESKKRDQKLYEFGLGRRENNEPLSVSNDDENIKFNPDKMTSGNFNSDLDSTNWEDYKLNKRAATIYEFGLGKRKNESSKNKFEKNSESFEQEDKKDSFDDSKVFEDLYKFSKRETGYKEGREESDSKIKSLYDFGIGKRIPYNLGLDKRYKIYPIEKADQLYNLNNIKASTHLPTNLLYPPSKNEYKQKH